MSSAGRNPTRRPLHPRPAGSFQAKSKSQSVLETSSSTMFSPLSKEQTVTADFILDPPPTSKRWAWGCFFFRGWGLSVPPMSSPQKIHMEVLPVIPLQTCVPINQVTLVSSSQLPSECTAFSSSCYRLSLYAKLCTHKSTTDMRISHYSLLLLIPELCRVDAWQVQIQVTVNGGKMCWPWAVLWKLVWNEVSDVMLFVEKRRVKGGGGRKYDKRHLRVWKS